MFVSDGSTDDTVPVIVAHARSARIALVELPQRGGKAAALNAGLARVTGEIVVFTDASIALAPDSLRAIVQPFVDPRVGCVSGEDRIAGHAAAKGLYGRYELLLRRLESDVHSIVGASGSFYAQRRALCTPFTEGHGARFPVGAADRASRAIARISDPAAVGEMSSVKNPRSRSSIARCGRCCAA